MTQELDELIMVDGDSIRQSEIEEEAEQVEQIELPLLPDEPPEVRFEGEKDIDLLIGKLETYPATVPLNAAFLRSVETWGVREPIELNRLPNDKYQLLAGRRRLAAAVALKLPSIKVRIYELGSLAASTMTIDSNAQRSDNPLGDYHAIIDLITDARAKGKNLTEREISQATGMPVGTIRKRMKLAEIPGEIVQAVASKQVALGTAEAIAGLSIEDQYKLLDLLEQNGKITGKDVAEIKQATQTEAASQIPAEAFDTPGFDAEAHIHDFDLDVDHGEKNTTIQATCKCGRVVSWTEIEHILNRTID